MLRRGLVAAVVIAACSMLAVARASAHPATTSDDLVPYLVTADNVNTALGANASSDSVTACTDAAPLNGAVVSASRVFITNNGLFGVSLFANGDGSGITGDEQNGVLSGQYIQDYAGGVFSSIDSFSLGGSSNVADFDQTATFTAVFNGNPVNVVADAFTKNNVFGVVIYATSGQADPALLGGVLGHQVLRLS